MRSFPFIPLALALSLGYSAYAEDAAVTEASAQSAAALASTQFSTFERGDGILALTLGASVPLGWYNPTTAAFEAANATPGFAFALSYTGFFNEAWALAGDLAGGFVGTVTDRRLFVAPLALRAVRVFPLGSFVIAPSIGGGLAISALGDYKHADALFKAGSSFLWRATSDMSYALNVYGNVIPQFMEIEENSRVGFFMEATLSVAYHL